MEFTTCTIAARKHISLPALTSLVSCSSTTATLWAMPLFAALLSPMVNQQLTPRDATAFKLAHGWRLLLP
ncbi:MAG: hypothetical protein GPOALKHO_000732 [Sodalis sp.]|nr:MAG: hypothetical protein GPOALKHO_000732 [Sodalis sp.]